ncbi:MAG: dienelactone hydrolase family protein [Spirochaetales bacterium]|nr:dienelactone hydrolase family protein [Leptospiraceae bacterium]MCP5482013.1 dienelactone hydrolase family protein [Spirochaetales bacterium]MCP5486494.1 dienelactone hydrolase family protein [Spirochaetales bacterium]
MTARSKTVRIKLSNGDSIASVLRSPPHFEKAVVIANGAGAAMDHEFISYFHEALADSGYLSVKFNFPYQEHGRRAPDSKGRLEDCYLRVYAYLVEQIGITPDAIVLGGKSMGGRIASQIANRTQIKKLVFLGYPLHAPGRPDRLKTAHLGAVRARMLFLQGDRDRLADIEKLRQTIATLPKARLVEFAGADHSFAVPKKSGIDPETLRQRMVNAMCKFIGP